MFVRRPFAMMANPTLTEEKRSLGLQIIEGAASYIPGIEKATLLEVRSGVIYSVGDADPFDPQSTMHARDATGFSELAPGWISLDTGKRILGPLYAVKVCDLFRSRQPLLMH